MATPPKPTPAPEAAPATATATATDPSGTSTSEAAVSVLAGVKDLLPSVALSIGLGLMIFKAVPTENHDPVLAIISGMLGFLTGRGSTARQARVTAKAAGDA